MRFKGKTVIVTGSGREKGLGVAILRRFADEGANCVVTDLGVPKVNMGPEHIGSSDEMLSIAKDLEKRGSKVLVHACDIRIDNEVERLIGVTLNTFGGIDILVNNAGIGYIMKPLLETSADEWDAVIGVNLSGAFHASKHAAKAMIVAGNGGSIINIASQAAKSGFPHMAPYCSSKHGMIGLTRSNAVELGKYGIRVNAVCPNHVTTGLGEKQNEYFSKLLGFENVNDYLNNMANKNPLGRPGLASDTAGVCTFLASDDAKYITGEAMNVSGGEEMH